MVSLLVGKVVPFAVFIAFWILQYLAHYMVQNDMIGTEVARISAYDAIDECIDRCVEMGKPIYYTTGDWALLAGRNLPAIIASLNILSYIAKQTAEKNVDLYVCIARSHTYTLTVDTVREAYAAVNRVDSFDMNKMMYWSDNFPAFQAGSFELVDQVRPAAYMNIGIAADSSVNTPGYALVRGIDMVSIGGVTDRTQVPPCVYGCDHWLIAEEVYAAGLYASGEKEAAGSMFSSDIIKGFMVVLVLIAFAGALVGSNIMASLLTI
jgi:hypothetical protein